VLTGRRDGPTGGREKNLHPLETLARAGDDRRPSRREPSSLSGFRPGDRDIREIKFSTGACARARIVFSRASPRTDAEHGRQEPSPPKKSSIGRIRIPRPWSEGRARQRSRRAGIALRNGRPTPPACAPRLLAPGPGSQPRPRRAEVLAGRPQTRRPIASRVDALRVLRASLTVLARGGPNRAAGRWSAACAA